MTTHEQATPDHTGDPLELLTVDEVAAMFKVKRNFVYDQVENGFLPVVRFKRHLRFRRSELEAFLQRQSSAP